MTAALDALPDGTERPRRLRPRPRHVRGGPAHGARAASPTCWTRGARLDVVSLTAEGRALGIAERDRLVRGGAERGRTARPGLRARRGGRAGGASRRALGRRRDDAIVVVGGNDLGPRSWVEQVVPRVGDVPVLAVTPVGPAAGGAAVPRRAGS